MSTRIKSKPTFATRVEFELAVDKVAQLSLEVQALETRRDLAIQDIRDQYSDELEPITSEIKLLVAQADKYAEENYDQLFGKKRSAESPLARFGFRTGQPTLKTLSRVTWKKVLDKLKELSWTSYIAIKEAPDKDAIKNDFSAEDLQKIGCKIEQAETFYIEPKDPGAVAHN